MLNCSGCWENPCICGKGYDHLTNEQKKSLAASLIGSVPISVGTCKQCKHWQSKENIVNYKYNGVDDFHIRTEAVSSTGQDYFGVCDLLTESYGAPEDGVNNAYVFTQGDDAVFTTGSDFCCSKFNQKGN